MAKKINSIPARGRTQIYRIALLPQKKIQEIKGKSSPEIFLSFHNNKRVLESTESEAEHVTSFNFLSRYKGHLNYFLFSAYLKIVNKLIK